MWVHIVITHETGQQLKFTPEVHDSRTTVNTLGYGGNPRAGS